MAIRTPAQYREGLYDNRAVWYQGKRVADVCEHPELRPAVDHSAIAYAVALDPANRDLAVDTVQGELFSAMFRAPASADDLQKRAALIELTSAAGAGVIVLKEVGTDALFALLRVLEGEGLENAQAFAKRCRAMDLAIAVAQTDVKGDRSKPPHEQSDPDLYLRVVDEDSDSIVVRGAKCHTSFSANADELVVLPTRNMGEQDRDYAVSFAIPINTPGLHIYVSPYSHGERNTFEFPISARHKLLESLTVFDNVRVPKERVFLNREPKLAGPLAVAFTDFHRFTAVNYKLPLLDIFVGAAISIAELNGIARAGHVRDKITQLIAYNETVRGLSQLAATRGKMGARGMFSPDPLAVNMAKYTFAHGYHDAVATLVDLAGGLLVTGPGGADWDSPEVRSVLEKYYVAGGSAEERLRMMNLIADLTARDYGGYQSVLATHAEGSLEAEKLQILRSYDSARAVKLAKRLCAP